jgi:4-amino-4-deoxy-L-arabinose transferase-like glycosyltransferase
VATRNSTGWTTGGRKSAGSNGLRRQGINLTMLGAFALVAAGAASVIGNSNLPLDLLMLVGTVMCLTGWRMLVIARRREHPSEHPSD